MPLKKLKFCGSVEFSQAAESEPGQAKKGSDQHRLASLLRRRAETVRGDGGTETRPYSIYPAREQDQHML